MCLEISWIKLPSLSLFYTSDLLFCCPVSPCIFFLTLTAHLFSPLYYYSSCYWSGQDTDTSNFFTSQDSMLILLVTEQYSPDIVGRRLNPVWNCRAKPPWVYFHQLLTMLVPSSITVDCQLCYLFSKHAFDCSVFSQESLGLVPQAWHTS